MAAEEVMCKHTNLGFWRNEKRISRATFYKCKECDKEIVFSDLEASAVKIDVLDAVRIKMTWIPKTN